MHAGEWSAENKVITERAAMWCEPHMIESVAPPPRPLHQHHPHPTLVPPHLSTPALCASSRLGPLDSDACCPSRRLLVWRACWYRAACRTVPRSHQLRAMPSQRMLPVAVCYDEGCSWCGCRGLALHLFWLHCRRPGPPVVQSELGQDPMSLLSPHAWGWGRGMGIGELVRSSLVLGLLQATLPGSCRSSSRSSFMLIL